MPKPTRELRNTIIVRKIYAYIYVHLREIFCKGILPSSVKLSSIHSTLGSCSCSRVLTDTFVRIIGNPIMYGEMQNSVTATRHQEHMTTFPNLSKD